MTTNQLNQWRKTSDLWYIKDHLPKNKQNLQINYKNRGSSPYVNVIWAGLNREFNDKFTEVIIYRHFCLFSGKEIDIQKELTRRPCIYIHTSICQFWWNIQFTVSGLRDINNNGEKRYSICAPGNMKLTEANIISYVFKYVQDNEFFAEGYYKDLQIYNLMTKDSIKYYLRKKIERKTSLISYDEATVTKWIKKHFNIDISEVYFDEGIAAVNRLGRQSTLRVLSYFSMDFMYDLEGDIDEVEEVFWEELSNYKENALFI